MYFSVFFVFFYQENVKNIILFCVYLNIIKFFYLLVGVGDAEFDAMDELDSDDVRLTVDGRYAERDIVQFVPLNKFMSKTGSFIKSQTDLAKEVLAEIPEQLTSFMKSRGIRPQIQPQSVPQNSTTLYPTAPIS